MTIIVGVAVACFIAIDTVVRVGHVVQYGGKYY